MRLSCCEILREAAADDFPESSSSSPTAESEDSCQSTPFGRLAVAGAPASVGGSPVGGALAFVPVIPFARISAARCSLLVVEVKVSSLRLEVRVPPPHSLMPESLRSLTTL